MCVVTNTWHHFFTRVRRHKVAKNLNDVTAALPKDRRQRVEARAMALATLKDLRQAAQQTQEQLAAALGVGQNTISRLEVRRKSTQRRTRST